MTRARAARGAGVTLHDWPGNICPRCAGRGWIIVNDKSPGERSYTPVCPLCMGDKTIAAPFGTLHTRGMKKASV